MNQIQQIQIGRMRRYMHEYMVIFWNCSSIHTRQEKKKKKKRETNNNNYIVGTNDCAGPGTHVDIISIIHSIAYSSISNTFFTTFKLLQQSEVARHCSETQTVSVTHDSAIILSNRKSQMDCKYQTNLYSKKLFNYIIFLKETKNSLLE